MDLREIDKSFIGKTVTLQGWIRNHRKQKDIHFIDFYDGTVSASVQVVFDCSLGGYDAVKDLRVGCAVTVTGEVAESPGKGQDYEIKAVTVKLEGDCPENYPIQPKRHSAEFLRGVAHLRPRVKLFQSVFRVRSEASAAIHEYFHSRGYVYVHTPIITANDGEGAGAMFQVTTLDLGKTAGAPDYSRDFFGKRANLTVTGQLEAETFAMAFKKVYTFGPTFRAENSNTKTHASEFWMVEPEIAFCDLNGLMDIEEEFLKFVAAKILERCGTEINFLDSFVQKGLREKLETLTRSRAARVTHREAIDILRGCGKKFENEPRQGADIAKEHERYLTDERFKSPVFVYDWPRDIKAFYMKQNPDGETVAAVDLLVPSAGELMGGSQREESLEKLERRMDELGMEKSGFGWYLDLRRYGGCVHSGFGMGFERLLIYLTGAENIRDVIPFCRTPGNCEF